MGQKGFFDIAQRYAGLDAKNDPLARIDEVVPWEDFRPRLEAAWRKPTEERKSPAGRKPWDAVVMFKAIVLCELYNLSDDQVEYQLRDRLSFMRFLGLGLEDKVPDAKTVWLYREQLAQAGVIETLFEDFDGYLEPQGYLAMGGQIIDASIVPVPKQRNSGDDNARIKEGETPEGWENQPAKRSQKDTDARWTKKHGKSHYGYKNHVNVDRRHSDAGAWKSRFKACRGRLSEAVEETKEARRAARDVPSLQAEVARLETLLSEAGIGSNESSKIEALRKEVARRRQACPGRGRGGDGEHGRRPGLDRQSPRQGARSDTAAAVHRRWREGTQQSDPKHLRCGRRHPALPGPQGP